MTTIPENVRHDDDATWITFAIALLRYPRTLIAVSGLITAAVLVTAILSGRTYTAESRFLPEGTSQGAARGLAAQLGLDMSVRGGESGELYQTLLTSRELLMAVARTPYRFLANRERGDSLAGTLMEVYRIQGKTEEQRLRATIETLKEDIVSVTVDRLTNLVTVRTTTPWPELSTLLNRRMLDLVNEFNVERRQTRAATERRFVEERLAQAREELQAAEAEMDAFLARNRGYETSPQQRFEAGRVQRQVDLRQQVFLTLSNAYENARIEEVRNTSVITVLDPPALPQPSGGRTRRVLVGAVLSVGFAVGVALLLEFVRRMRTHRPDLFEEMAQSARLAVRRVVPGLTRRR